MINKDVLVVRILIELESTPDCINDDFSESNKDSEDLCWRVMSGLINRGGVTEPRFERRENTSVVLLSLTRMGLGQGELV